MNEPMTIIVIPAEGDSAETEIWYIKKLKQYYWRGKRRRVEILVYEHGRDVITEKDGVAISTLVRVREFAAKYDFRKAEIHAQGGLGAYAAYEFLQYCPERIERVFMVGGSTCETMTWVAKIFHRHLIRWWYRLRWIKPFFADDPNPLGDEDIRKIKDSSTKVMRANPEVYRDQLLFIGRWSVSKYWRVPDGCEVVFVPNGETVRPKLWDNTYDDAKAREFWRSHGAKIAEQPGENFSFYSMMPARALFEVMDRVR